MKKLVSLLLVCVMLLGVLCSCNDTDKDVNIPSDDTNTPSNEDKPSDEENTPSDEENTPNDETKKPSNEDDPDTIPDIIITDPNGDIGKASNIRGDGEVVFGKTGERALYVKSWDKSFPLPNDCNVKDCLIVEDYMWVVLFDYGNDCATTMKISRDGETSESYNYTFPVETCYDESTSDSWVFNCYSEDCFYAFFMDASEVKNGNRYSYYTVTTFKSLDYGKTWTKEPGLQAGIGDWNAGPEIFKFVSRDVGFIVYYDAGRDYSDFTVYATSNGGATWDIQRFNIKDNSEDYFRSFKKLQATEDGYVATFEVSRRGDDGWDYENAETLKYFSSDLKTWTLLEENKPSDEEKPNDQVTEDNTVSIGQTQYNFNFDDRIACNGVFYNNDVSYTINQDKDLVLHVNSWNESFVVPKGNMNIVGETVYDSSVVLCEDRGALIFRDYSREEDPIKVIKFVKGNPQVTIEDLSAPLNDCYSEKYCYFINKNIGYLFLFNVDDSSRKVLSEFWKTTDGGQTWIEQSFDGEFDIDWRERIICAKMIDENIGFISAGHRADDNLGRRVYITKDGGKTWEKVWKHKEVGSTEAYDFLYENGQYVILLRSRDTNGKYVFWRYVSTDMKNWSAVAPAYVDLIFCYEDLWDKRLYGDENSDKPSASDYALSKENFDAICKAVSADAIAYAFKDLNNDSVDELILLDYEHYLYAIFTLKDGATTLVDTFEYLNHVGAIDKDGTIYKSGYGKGDTDYCSVMTLKNDGTLDGLTYGKIDYTDVFDNPTEVTYYQNVSGVYSDITKEEFDSIAAEYEHVFRNMNSLTKSAGLTLHYAFEFDPK